MYLRLAAICTLFASATIPCFADSYPVGGGTADFSGSGTLTARSLGDGRYRITDITGPGVTGLLDRRAYRRNDNILLPDQETLLDSDGFAFTDVQGDTGYTVKLFASGANAYGGYVLDSDGVE
ncbi:MAG: hypothetical protein INR62_06540, partial [Rhodospirillales bacterium]|nr:hypothetical protein [Acetobacter sp.]